MAIDKRYHLVTSAVPKSFYAKEELNHIRSANFQSNVLIENYNRIRQKYSQSLRKSSEKLLFSSKTKRTRKYE